jgi:hypothetical protein
MSRFSEKREQAGAVKKGPRWLWLFVVCLLLLIAWAAYYLFHYHSLSSFAQCLQAKQAKMYGAWWCPHCADQKQELGRAFRYVHYVECSRQGSRTISQECSESGIRHFPTWQFADGSRVEGVLPLAELSQKTGCSLP